MALQEPDYDLVAKVLAAQQQAARNAGKRRGERPRDLPSRNQIVNEFTMVSLSNRMTSYMVMTTVIGEPYHPSTASLNTLKKMSIKDLKIEINHRGFYMLLRFLCPPMRMTAIMDVIPWSIQIQFVILMDAKLGSGFLYPLTPSATAWTLLILKIEYRRG